MLSAGQRNAARTMPHFIEAPEPARRRSPDNTLTPIYSTGRQTIWQTGSVVVNDVDRLLQAVPRCGLVVVAAAYQPAWSLYQAHPAVAVVPLVDASAGLGRDHLVLVDRAWRIVEGGWRAGHDVVVACEAGVQRSAGVILCWLTRARGMPLSEALALLQRTRGDAIGRDYYQLFSAPDCPADGLFGHILAIANRTSDATPHR